MTAPVFLIDFENVQPKALDRLKPGTSRIKVFLGQHQSKLMLELVQALQPFGADAEYIQIQGSGPDAVDFHIAFYIGRLASSHPGAAFNIISKDKGFDPLVKHLAQLGIACKRLPEIPAIAPAAPTPPAKAVVVSKPSAAKPKATKAAAANPNATKPTVTQKPAKAVKVTVLPAKAPTKVTAANGTSTKARAKTVVELLKKSTKPAKLATLRSTIKACFKPALDESAIDAVVQSLRSSKKIDVAGDKVSYALG